MKRKKISWAAAAVCFLLMLFGVTIYTIGAFRKIAQEISSGKKWPQIHTALIMH